MSGQQVVFWYEQALRERGEEKLLDLQVSLVPHTERPNDTLRDLQNALLRMTKPQPPKPQPSNFLDGSG